MRVKVDRTKIKSGLKTPSIPIKEAVPFENPVRLVTVEEASAPHPSQLEGCIVRVRPNSQDGQEFKAWLERVREVALRVIVLPSREDKVLPNAAREASPRVEDARHVVNSLVDESNVEDRDSLRLLTQSVMDEVGL